MNKDPVSWIHYALITITASVLAYVSIVEPSDNDTSSAVDMLPELYDKNNDTSEIQQEEQPMETINTEIPEAVAQPVYRGGKLKKTKNNIKRNRTRNKRS